MQRIKMNGFARFLVLVAMAMFVLPLGPGISLADKAPAIKMKHKPIKYYVPEKRIRLEAKVKSEDKVDMVRCYFKGETHADYVFVPMAPLKEGLYSAILPAPSVDSEVITYLFLVVTDKNDVVRTQEYNIEKRDEDKTPAWQAIKSEGNIHVSTELAEAPSMVAGFTDSIVVDVVESAARFGFVTYGIYTASQITAAGGTTGSAATATGAGVVTASSGMSTAAIVGIGVGAALVIGGGAAAGIALANKDDDEDGGDTGSDLPGGTGEVKVTLQWSDCNDLDLHVTDPCGNTINFTNRSASCDNQTGRLDIDANVGSCSPNPAENIFWTTAPAGNYTVRVNYYSGSGASSFVVTTIVNGNRNTFNGSIGSGTQTITSFSK